MCGLKQRTNNTPKLRSSAPNSKKFSSPLSDNSPTRQIISKKVYKHFSPEKTFSVLSNSHPDFQGKYVFFAKRYFSKHAARISFGSKQMSLYSVPLAKDRLHIPLLVMNSTRQIRLRERDFSAFCLALDFAFESRRAISGSIFKLIDETNLMKDSIPDWLVLKLWVGREVLIDNVLDTTKILFPGANKCFVDLLKSSLLKNLFYETEPEYILPNSELELVSHIRSNLLP